MTLRTHTIILAAALSAAAPMAFAKGHDQGAGVPQGGPSAGSAPNPDPGNDARTETAETAQTALGFPFAETKRSDKAKGGPPQD